MKKIILNKLFLLKASIVVLALGNLVFLFGFNYQLPGLFPDSSTNQSSPLEDESDEPQDNTEYIGKEETEGDNSSTEDNTNSEHENPSENSRSWSIQIPSESLYYDGTQDLNLNDGVTVLDSEGKEQEDANIFISIVKGEVSTEKIIEYSARDEEGQRITARRTLTLSNYSGPSISVLGELPELSVEDLPNLLTILQTENLILAKDGWGKDITSSVTASTVSEEPEDGIYVFALSIVNMLNDSYTTEITISAPAKGPIIKLITDKVTLKVGEYFSFYNYIEYAKDENGNDLSHHISIEGKVDTSKTGTYQLVFYCVTPDGVSSPRKTLTVIVES